MRNIQEKLDNIFYGMCSLTVFRNLLKDEVISALMELFEGQIKDKIFNINRYAEFVSKLYRHDIDLSHYLLKIVLEDDNFYIRIKSQKNNIIDEFIEDAVVNELNIIQELSNFTPKDLQYGYYRNVTLAQWHNSDIDFVAEYKKRIDRISQYGYGKFSTNKMFILKNKDIIPVKFTDDQRLFNLFGYEHERHVVINNTLALIEGRSSQNVLLYGDAGTGKSSTVKAIVNEFENCGLRLVEITKEQIREIPFLIDTLRVNPLKFIIFIDDLTFVYGEDCFCALKAALEGSISASANNIVIYATSNRRHLVREIFSDREGDEVHRNDTMQEILSLYSRFGLRVNFIRPDKKSYIAIAIKLARANGIDLSDNEIALKAEQFAISSGNGRSPRTAKQFITQLYKIKLEYKENESIRITGKDPKIEKRN